MSIRRRKLWFAVMLLMSFGLGMVGGLGLSWSWTGDAKLIVPLFGVFGLVMLLIFVMISFMEEPFGLVQEAPDEGKEMR